jgi:hypothetical protein
MPKKPVLLAFLLAGSGFAPAQDSTPPPAAGSLPFSEMTPEIRASVERGLAWLSKAQSPSGAFGSGSAPVATTAIAGMAFLAGGHLPGRSRYGDNVKRALTFILKNSRRVSQERVYINEGQQRGIGGSGMHGHGYATLFLAECYGMTGEIPDFENDVLKERLAGAIHLIESAQADNGGWYYEPERSNDEGSVTVTQVQALRAARNAGIKVDMKTIAKAIEYINKSTNSEGQTRYSLTGGGHTSFALTSAGMSVLNFLGAYDNPKIKKGLDSVVRTLPGEGGNNPAMGGAWGGWYFYGNYYATLACYQAGSPYWQKWWPAISRELLRTQSPNGCWKNGESASYGEAFGTGLGLQILQIPNRYCPIYQRGSD